MTAVASGARAAPYDASATSFAGVIMRAASIAAAITLTTIHLAAATEVDAAAIKRFVSIPPQDLESALATLAQERDFQILYRSEVVGERQTAGAVGELTAQETLEKLLSGTGLGYKYLDEKAITIFVAGAPPAGESAPREAQPPSRKPESKSAWQRFRLAQAEGSVASTALAASASSEGGATSSAGAVDEVVVSAQKKSERLMDVPVPVSVLNADSLASKGQLLLREYYNTVPGLNLVTNYGFTQNLAIRGVTTGGFANPTIGITLDDVPYSGSSNSAGGNQIPDIDPGDLERIEVLRGPQGALYGANSMGGLIKYVTRDPSFSSFGARIEAGSNMIHGGSDAGYVLRGSANVPVSETFALRVSAYGRKDPGYIDNPVLGIDGINDVKASGARVAALWNLTDTTSLKLNALFQHAQADGLADAFVRPGFGDLQQSYMPGIGGSDRRVQAYSAILQTRFGATDFVSITGYSINKYENVFDRSGTYGALIVRDLPQLHVDGVAGIDRNTIDKLTEELRFSGALGDSIEWVLGGFYMKEDLHGKQRLMAANRNTGEILALELLRDVPVKDTEYAAFANVTYHFTDRFDVQFGARESQNREDDAVYVQTGPFIAGGIQVQEPLHSKANTFTYLMTPRLRIAADLMLYARFASGYRPGGPNFAINFGAPPAYKPDTTKNYEVGFKGDFLEGALSLDASLYYIDWKNIQLSLRTPPPENYTYLDNASRARSQGVELSVTARPLRGTSVNGWMAYNDAKLTEAFPAGPTFGAEGSRLPNTPRTSGHLSIQQEFPLGNATGFVEGAVTYVGERISLFTGNSVRQAFPSYTKTDFRAGMTLDTWAASLYVNNVTDERGVIGGGIAYQPAYAFVYIQPRTVGVSISKTF